MTKEFTLEGKAKLKVGNVLAFMDSDSNRHDYQIMSLDDGQVKAKEITTYTPDQVMVTDEDGITKSLPEFESEV
jgi:hypothetical protein